MDLNICEDYNKLEKKFQLQNIFIPNFVARIELNSEVNNKNLENERAQKLKARFGRNILFMVYGVFISKLGSFTKRRRL